jgi:enoyl-CoA hydratase/carnithine racemase
MAASYLLPRVVGLAKATEMLFTGDFVSAAEAERIGLYNRVVPAGELATATRDFAERLARGPAFALGKTKEMLNRELDMNLQTALESEAQAQAICMQHPDYREAYEAFVAKRVAKFK